MSRTSAAWALVLLAGGIASAHDPITTNLTWSMEISRIVFKRCVSCHRAGGMAPMSLVSYDEARPWAKAIRDEVLEWRMPPWGPVKGVGEFLGDRSLSQPEIDMLVGWVEGGAPEGEKMYLPAVPPAESAAAERMQGRKLAVKESLVLAAPATIMAILPQGVSEHGSFEVLALKPDEAVARLIWIRDFREKWNRAYDLRTPLALPRGTRVAVYSGPGAAAVLLLSR